MADGKRAVIADSDSRDGQPAMFILSAGRYLVVINEGQAKTSVEVDVKPGERTEVGLIFPGEG